LAGLTSNLEKGLRRNANFVHTSRNSVPKFLPNTKSSFQRISNRDAPSIFTTKFGSLYPSTYGVMMRSFAVELKDRPTQHKKTVKFPAGIVPNRKQKEQTLVEEPQQQEPNELQPQGSQYDAITPDVFAHLRNVYLCLSANIFTSGVAATAAVAGGVFISPIVGGLGGLALVLGISFMPQTYSQARLGMLFSFAALEGLTFAPMIAQVMAVNPGAIAMALLGTGAIFAGFTAMSLVAKRGAMLKFGGPLIGSLLAIIVLQIAGWFFPALAPIAFNISLYGGLGIFSLFIAWDTQRMIESAQEGKKDVVGDSLSMFLNVINIFIRLLSIFTRRD